MRALAIDVTQRYQSVADMASDLERTLIAARYSSRELSKLLHGLFLPDEDPVVVVDTDDHHTVAMTGARPEPAERAAIRRRPGRRRASARRAALDLPVDVHVEFGVALDAGIARNASDAGQAPHFAVRCVTDPLPPIPEATELLRAGLGRARLERVVQAERGRLARKRMRGKLRILGVIAGLAIIVGAGVWAGHRYLPALLAPPPPPPKPAPPVPLPNQATPEPAAAKPKKPRPSPPQGDAAHAAARRGRRRAGRRQRTACRRRAAAARSAARAGELRAVS